MTGLDHLTAERNLIVIKLKDSRSKMLDMQNDLRIQQDKHNDLYYDLGAIDVRLDNIRAKLKELE